MLRADPFTLLAVDARRSFAAFRRGGSIRRGGFGLLAVGQLFVGCGENFRNGDLFRAAGRAVMAGRTGNGRTVAQNVLGLLDHLLLRIIERLEVRHCRKVVVHLFQV